jgi:hypothetical protein
MITVDLLCSEACLINATFLATLEMRSHFWFENGEMNETKLGSHQ